MQLSCQIQKEGACEQLRGSYRWKTHYHVASAGIVCLSHLLKIVRIERLQSKFYHNIPLMNVFAVEGGGSGREFCFSVV